MKRKYFFILLVVLLLTGCNNDVDVVQKYKNAMNEISRKEVYHTKELLVWKVSDAVQVEQRKEIFYSKGNLFHNVVQNGVNETNVVCIDDEVYINQIVKEKNLGWDPIADMENVEGFLPWIVKNSTYDSRNDKYITYEESAEGIVVTYDRSGEVSGESSDYNVTIETYYFDTDWKLQKVEIVAEAMFANENGEMQEAEVTIMIEFFDTPKQDIDKKIEDAFSEVE